MHIFVKDDIQISRKHCQIDSSIVLSLSSNVFETQKTFKRALTSQVLS